MSLSICTTNYNCGHALGRHLESVYRILSGLDFEYVVVDNLSKDGSWEILTSWATDHLNMKVLRLRSTMGEGRQLAFKVSAGNHILVLDTDVVYAPILRSFVDVWLSKYSHLSVQAIFAGVFPRNQWMRVGGRRSLNTNEDVDLWLRILRLGTMRWYPVVMGENLKDANAWGRSDYLSTRYGKRERILRLARREWDLFKTRHIESLDLGHLVETNTLDLGLGPSPGAWPQSRERSSRLGRMVQFAREFKQALVS